MATGQGASQQESLHCTRWAKTIKANSASHLTSMDLERLPDLIACTCSLCFPTIRPIPGPYSLYRMQGNAALFRCRGLTTACTDKILCTQYTAMQNWTCHKSECFSSVNYTVVGLSHLAARNSSMRCCSCTACASPSILSASASALSDQRLPGIQRCASHQPT